MNRISGIDYKEAKAIDMDKLLNSYGMYSNNRLYSCLFHEDKKPSSSVGRKNKLHCFSCGKTSSTIDVVMHCEGCDEFTAIRKLLDNKITLVSKTDSTIAKYNTIKYDYNFGLNISKSLNNQNIGFIKTYLHKRCILNILDIANNLGIEIRHNYYNNKNYICYNFKDFNFIIQKSLDGSNKKNFGSPVPTYFKINESNEWYITEGIEDSFSLILSHKYNVICLNSISNIDKFLGEVNTGNKYIVATDNDTSGQKTKDTIIEKLKKMNVEVEPYINFYKFAEKHNLKDINECFVYTKEIKKFDNKTI